MGRNLTLRLSPELVRRARALALKRGLSLNAWVAELLEKEVEREEGLEEAFSRQLSWMRQGILDTGGVPLPSREEVHDRAP
ncbi:toxin-antitoxin system HicB family antitoxin [Thermus amyloliquefaciens]|uniref:toxin-antitoxin system HicB family antitoxin n=1 Tax=Thermus amyloliquefaciens TaxID=1449080 RepID=UPI000571763D|nr:toxin-antitoxin system HicB family antitoxin [Thermus amyloliquefaciens]